MTNKQIQKEIFYDFYKLKTKRQKREFINNIRFTKASQLKINWENILKLYS